MERSRRNKIIGIGAAVVLVLVIWSLATRGNDVETVRVQVGDIIQTVEDIGYVRATEESSLYATQAATVAQLNFEVGQPVKAGQVVMVLENRELKVQVADTESALSQAEATSRALVSGLRLAEMGLKNARITWNESRSCMIPVRFPVLITKRHCWRWRVQTLPWQDRSHNCRLFPLRSKG